MKNENSNTDAWNCRKDEAESDIIKNRPLTEGGKLSGCFRLFHVSPPLGHVFYFEREREMINKATNPRRGKAKSFSGRIILRRGPYLFHVEVVLSGAVGAEAVPSGTEVEQAGLQIKALRKVFRLGPLAFSPKCYDATSRLGM